MHVHAYQPRRGIRVQDGSRLFHHLAAARIANQRIVRFDVSSRQQPALQTPVQHQQDTVPPRAEHQARTGDVARAELPPRKRLGRGGQRRQRQSSRLLAASPSSAGSKLFTRLATLPGSIMLRL